MASVVAGAPTETHSPRIGLVFWLWQCNKENHGWREVDVLLSAFDEPVEQTA
jgi:hypothetical protein